MKRCLHRLNSKTEAREVFAKVQFTTDPRNGEWIETGTYTGEIDQITLLENTIAAIESEIERLKAK